jgi:hypothetical protein
MTANRTRPAGAAAHLAPFLLTKTTEKKELVSKAPLIMSGFTSRPPFQSPENWLCFALLVYFDVSIMFSTRWDSFRILQPIRRKPVRAVAQEVGPGGRSEKT